MLPRSSISYSRCKPNIYKSYNKVFALWPAPLKALTWLTSWYCLHWKHGWTENNNCIIFDTEVGVCTRRASLSIRLQVDAGGTGTAGGFGSRGQETEVAAASIILRTRVTNYRWRHTKQLSSSSILLSRLASRQGMDRGWGRLGKQNRKTQLPWRELGESPTHEMDEISEVSVWYVPPEALCQWSGFSLPVIPSLSAETQDLSSEERRQKTEK